MLEINADGFQCIEKQAAAVGIDPSDDALQRVFGGSQVLILAVQLVITCLQTFKFFQCFHVDIAGALQLCTQVIDFFFSCFPIFGGFPVFGDFTVAEIELIVFHDPFSERVAA